MWLIALSYNMGVLSRYTAKSESRSSHTLNTCAEGMNKMLLRYFFREAEHHSSQRHGILERKNGHLCFRQAREILAVYPSHACLRECHCVRKANIVALKHSIPHFSISATYGVYIGHFLSGNCPFHPALLHYQLLRLLLQPHSPPRTKRNLKLNQPHSEYKNYFISCDYSLCPALLYQDAFHISYDLILQLVRRGT